MTGLPLPTMEAEAGPLLTEAAAQLRAVGIESARLGAELLLAHTFGITRTALLTHPERRLSAEEKERFELGLQRRSAREPLAYIVGEREFLSLRLFVSPAVLIPRPETELLAEFAINEARTRGARLGLDIGTGSGALAVSLAAAVSELHMIATDISPEALALARRNAQRHGVEARVRFVCCDLLGGLRGRADLRETVGAHGMRQPTTAAPPQWAHGMRPYDLIVANLPYVKTDEIGRLEPEISRYEPRGAIDGGLDGLDAFRRLLPSLHQYLAPGGFAALEVGAGQADAVGALAEEHGLQLREILNDLAGVPRIVVLEARR